MNAIADGNRLGYLLHLLVYLEGWKERPGCLTPMAYQWCSAISEAAGRLGRGGYFHPCRGPMGLGSVQTAAMVTFHCTIHLLSAFPGDVPFLLY